MNDKNLNDIKYLRTLEGHFWNGVTVLLGATFLSFIGWIWGLDGRWFWTFLAFAFLCSLIAYAIDLQCEKLEKKSAHQKPEF